VARGSNPSRGTRCFSSPESPGRVWGPPSPLFNGYRSSLRGVKRLGREADHSSPSGTKAKYEWSYSSDPLHALTAWTWPALLFFALTVNLYLLSNLKRCDKYEGHRNGPAEWQHLGLTGLILICVASCMGGAFGQAVQMSGLPIPVVSAYRHIPEDSNPYKHRCENPNPHKSTTDYLGPDLSRGQLTRVTCYESRLLMVKLPHIWGCRGHVEYFYALCCDAASVSVRRPTFRKFVEPSSSVVWRSGHHDAAPYPTTRQSSRFAPKSRLCVSADMSICATMCLGQLHETRITRCAIGSDFLMIKLPC